MLKSSRDRTRRPAYPGALSSRRRQSDLRLALDKRLADPEWSEGRYHPQRTGDGLVSLGLMVADTVFQLHASRDGAVGIWPAANHVANRALQIDDGAGRTSAQNDREQDCSTGLHRATTPQPIL